MLNSKQYNLFLLLTAFAFGSGLNITSQLSVFVLLSVILLFTDAIVILFCGSKLKITSLGYSNLFVCVFTIIVFYTMLIRGIGFEMLGSEKSGGMFYVKLISVLMLFIFMLKTKLSENYISKLFICLSVSFVLPFISDIVYLFSGGQTLFNDFVSGSSTIQFYANNSNTLLRIESGAPLAEYLTGITLVYFPIFNSNGRMQLNKVNLFLLSIILALVGISGHRMTLIGIILLILFYYYYSFGIKKLVKPILAITCIFLIVSTIAITQFEHLPPNFQRTFSFLPFTPANEVTLDASDSFNFRLLMAAKAYVMFPDYYILGKGFAFVNYSVDFSDYFGIIDIFSEIGVFHNGIIGLIINLGIPGLIFGLGIIFSIYRSLRKQDSRNSGQTERIRSALKSKILLTIVNFIFLYGDVQTNFIELMVLASFYKIVQYFMKQQSYTVAI